MSYQPRLPIRVKPTRQSFANYGYIRAHILVLCSKQFPCPAQTCLDLVSHQQDIICLADFRYFS